MSGGEPLILEDRVIDTMLGDIEALPRQVGVRIHTRALTFNPFRITLDLCEILRSRKVLALGVHVTHLREITSEFEEAVELLRGSVPILFSNIPLLAGINDDPETLHSLGMRLYRMGVRAGYLYHFLPFSPESRRFRSSVMRGVEVMNGLKRRITNLAVPEFVVAHQTGKFTVPLSIGSDESPRFVTDSDGKLWLEFSNWKGETVRYLDVA